MIPNKKSGNNNNHSNKKKGNNSTHSADAWTPITRRIPAADDKTRGSDTPLPELAHVGSAKLATLLKAKEHREIFLDREASWVEFNRRVLDEAQDPQNPLLERLKFLGIFSTNLDEFYMIRLAGILNQADEGIVRPALGGYAPQEELTYLNDLIVPLRQLQWEIWSQQCKPALAEQGIHVEQYSDLSSAERDRLRKFFEKSILPMLTPLMVDPTHPFPFISNLSMNFAIILRPEGNGDDSDRSFARLKIPPTLKRFVKIEEETSSGSDNSRSVENLFELESTAKKNALRFVLVEDVIRANLGLLFPGMIVEEAHLFRVIRDADVEIAEDEASDLLETMEKATRQRRFGRIVRVLVQPGAHVVTQLLIDAFEIDPAQLQVLNFFGYGSLWELASLPRPDLQFPTYATRMPEALQRSNGDVFKAMREGDILVHHPFDSFSPVASFFSQAARDPSVVAIKATLYRVGANSPIVEQLLIAAQNEIEVTVLVELKARFDEKNNIVWAKTLEAAGVHVVYGVKDLKTHAKLGLVIRREITPAGPMLRPYCHMSTGNYNHSTAKFYTDLGLFTARHDFGADVIRLFNRLTSVAPRTTYSRLLIAPEFLRNRIYDLISRETKAAQEGKEARIRIKCNSITDAAIITKLYEASHAGVVIQLYVRGVCCLRPGVPEISANITVSSVVGRFLEHSRVMWFLNGGSPEVYVGSADLMGRNLDRRVENYFPILDPAHKTWLDKYVLNPLEADNTKRRVLRSDGTWAKVERGEGPPINSQESAISALCKKFEDFAPSIRQAEVSYEGTPGHLKKLLKAATKRLV